MDERQGGRPTAREAALHRAARVKRWVVGGTVALTGVFSAVAANALPASHGTKAKTLPAKPVTPPVDQEDDQQVTPIAPPAQAPQPSAGSSSGAVSGGS